MAGMLFIMESNLQRAIYREVAGWLPLVQFGTKSAELDIVASSFWLVRHSTRVFEPNAEHATGVGVEQACHRSTETPVACTGIGAEQACHRGAKTLVPNMHATGCRESLYPYTPELIARSALKVLDRHVRHPKCRTCHVCHHKSNLVSSRGREQIVRHHWYRKICSRSSSTPLVLDNGLFEINGVEHACSAL